MATKAEGIAELERRQKLALEQGGEQRVARQHSNGRLTARERVDYLLDEGSFVEIGMLAHSDRPEVGEGAAADAVVTGAGTIDGRKVVLIAIDSTVFGGSNGRIGLRKQGHMNYLAEKKGVPLIVLGDASGGRIPDMLEDTFAEVNGLYEGEVVFGLRHGRVKIPRITAIMGNAYGDPSFYGAASDYVCMTRTSAMGLAGPAVVLGATGVRLSDAELAGPEVVANESGLVHAVFEDDEKCLDAVRRFLSFLPLNSTLVAPVDQEWKDPEISAESLYTIVPDAFNRAYDVREVIRAVVDGGSFFEVHEDYGRAVVGGLARMEGRPVVVVANQPIYQAGVADDQAILKTKGLVTLATNFDLPIVFLQDLPGAMVGPDVERRGILRAAIDLLRVVSLSSVPKVTVILRKAYGFGWVLFGGYPSGADYVVAWPNAEINFMAPDTGAIVLHNRKLQEIRQRDGDEAAEAFFKEASSELHRSSEAWRPASRAALHDIIRPEDTRRAILRGIFIGESHIDQRGHGAQPPKIT